MISEHTQSAVKQTNVASYITSALTTSADFILFSSGMVKELRMGTSTSATTATGWTTVLNLPESLFSNLSSVHYGYLVCESATFSNSPRTYGVKEIRINASANVQIYGMNNGEKYWGSFVFLDA